MGAIRRFLRRTEGKAFLRGCVFEVIGEVWVLSNGKYVKIHADARPAQHLVQFQISLHTDRSVRCWRFWVCTGV